MPPEYPGLLPSVRRVLAQMWHASLPAPPVVTAMPPTQVRAIGYDRGPRWCFIMTVWQSVVLAVGLTLLGCLVTYFYRPRAPKILWGSEVLPILPGPMQGVKIQLDDTSVSEFFLLNIAIRNGGASVGVDNTVRPLRLTLSENYDICKFVYLSGKHSGHRCELR